MVSHSPNHQPIGTPAHQHITSSDILYEDNHIIVVNKKPSQIVQGDKTGDITLAESVKGYIKEEYCKPGDVFLGTVHRIDRPVSGIVIYARTSKALARMNELFRSREVKKIYWAVVKNKPGKESGELIHYLKKNEAKNKATAFDREQPGTLKAELSYRLLCSSENYHLLEIHPHTGRHHQIRVQLAAMGCPIKGDVKYGYRRTNLDASIHLHARAIEFMHPVKKEMMRLIAPPPNEVLWNAFIKMMPEHNKA